MVGAFFEADVVACQDVADEDAVVFPADAAIGADASSFEVSWIGKGW
jgi:hypothetical protein